MDRAFHVHCQSMWGYLLGHALSPDTREGRAIVMCHFAYVTAVPGLYDQAVNNWRATNPNQPLLSLASAMITIMRFSTQEVISLNFSRDEVLHCLIHNRIPREWVAHAYYYSHHYLRQHLQSGDRYCIDNTLINDERIDTLMTQEEPEVYPPWDGWYHRTQHDLVRIHVLIWHEEEQRMITRDNPILIAVGEELASCVFSVLYPPAVPYQPLLSMPTGNRNMGAPAETSADTCTEETSSAQTHVKGLAALTMGETAQETPDVVMSTTAVGVEEESSAMLTDVPVGGAAPTAPVE